MSKQLAIQTSNNILVGGWATPLKKHESVRCTIPNIWPNKTCSKPSTRHNPITMPECFVEHFLGLDIQSLHANGQDSKQKCVWRSRCFCFGVIDRNFGLEPHVDPWKPEPGGQDLTSRSCPNSGGRMELSEIPPQTLKHEEGAKDQKPKIVMKKQHDLTTPLAQFYCLAQLPLQVFNWWSLPPNHAAETLSNCFGHLGSNLIQPLRPWSQTWEFATAMSSAWQGGWSKVDALPGQSRSSMVDKVL